MALGRKSKLQILSVYFICVAFAILLWLLTMLGKSYSTEISVPVEFTNLPQNKIVSSVLPTAIKVGVSGRGFNLIKLQVDFAKNDITFNIDELLHGGRSNRVHISQQDLRERISMQLTPSLSVTTINPESIDFTLEEIASKEVPVKLDCNISFNKLYTQKGDIKIEPKSVTIKGAHESIDSIEYITTEPLIKKELNSSIQQEINLVPTHNVAYSTDKVKVEIDAEQTTEAERNAIINVINLPSNVRMALFPESAKLTYKVGLSRYEESLKDNIHIVVDYNDTKDGRSFLNIKATETPSYIENLTITPQRVEYIIE